MTPPSRPALHVARAHVRSRLNTHRLIVLMLAATLSLATVSIVGAPNASGDTTSTVAGISGVCNDTYLPQIAVDDQGNELAAWYCLSGGSIGVNSTVQYSRSDAGGPWSPARTATTFARVILGVGPQIAVHNGLGLIVTASTQGGDVQFVDASGVHPVVVDDPSLVLDFPALATNAAGDIALAWRSWGGLEVHAVTGTFDAGLSPESTLSTTRTAQQGSNGIVRAAIDEQGNVVIGAGAGGSDGGAFIATAVANGAEPAWKTQDLHSYGETHVFIGGGQVTVIWGSLQGCWAAQQPIGGVLGPRSDMGVCAVRWNDFLSAQNASGMGLLVVDSGWPPDMSLMAIVVPPGGAPSTVPIRLSGDTDPWGLRVSSVVVDGNGVATVAWQNWPTTGNVDEEQQLTASLDLTQVANASSGQAPTAGSLIAAPDTTAADDSLMISHGMLDGSGTISLSSNASGLLAGIWGRGSTFGKGNLSPAINGLSLRTSGIEGGNAVTITGSKFVKDAAVFFGDVPASSVTYVSATQLKAVVPPHSAGEVTVRVMSQGASVPTTKSTFVYGPAPTISGLSPQEGNVAGGTDVTIAGANFVPGTTVKFGFAAATNVRYISSNTIVVTAPKHAVGTLAVIATTLAGSSAGTNADLFAYGPPKISSFTPTSASTGTSVKLTGVSFLPGSSVSFGGLESPAVTFVSGTQIKAVIPNGASTGDIQLTGPSGTATSATTLKVTFAVTGFSPLSGPPGTIITVSGVGFTPTSTAKIGGVSAPSTYDSPTQLRVTVPVGAVSGNVSVTKPYKGTVLSAGTFTVS